MIELDRALGLSEAKYCALVSRKVAKTKTGTTQPEGQVKMPRWNPRLGGKGWTVKDEFTGYPSYPFPVGAIIKWRF